MDKIDSRATMVYDAEGNKVWTLNNGHIHRDDGPAIEYANGRRDWYQHGLLHRVDGPANEYVDGDYEWYHRGIRHHSDGPAIDLYGVRKWYQWGFLHRDETDAAGEMLPAVIHSNGDVEWWLYGERHRENGPAVVKGDNLFKLLGFEPADENDPIIYPKCKKTKWYKHGTRTM